MPWEGVAIVPHQYRRKVKDQSEITIDMIEEALLVCADLVDTYGEVARPLLDRFEREYEIMKSKPLGGERARIEALLGMKGQDNVP